jgi:hypothetical protein
LGFFMSAVRPKFGLVVVITFALFASGSAYAAQKPLAAKRPVKQVQPAPEPVPAPPPPPSTLEQMPTSAPQVSFRNDQLIIVAHNSTLGDVLRAVRNQTGAAVEIPANATERVVGRFGPGPARDVLAMLLNGSHFNYVMLGSAANPNALDRVILTHKTGGSESSSPGQGTTGEQPIAGQPQGMPPGVVPPGQETEEMNDDFSDDAAGLEDQPADQNTQADEQQQQPNGQAGVKTPEQLLQELQRQQQQQQQPGAPQGFPVPPGGPLRPQPPQPIPPQQQQPPDQPPQ